MGNTDSSAKVYSVNEDGMYNVDENNILPQKKSSFNSTNEIKEDKSTSNLQNKQHDNNNNNNNKMENSNNLSQAPINSSNLLSKLNKHVSIARQYEDDGRINEAENIYLECLSIFQSKLGGDHSGTLEVMNNLANLYSDKGIINIYYY
jgi:hypothetical protein